MITFVVTSRCIPKVANLILTILVKPLTPTLGRFMSEYTIRAFRPDDVAGFLRLFSTVFGDNGRDWFMWKYRMNPYVGHIPIIVAEQDSEIVGARPFYALQMAINGEHHLALQPCDTMVHPDHRRNGLFTRMTECAIDRYQSGEPAFFFNFPNHLSLPGYLKLGWQRVRQIPRCYRLHDATAVLQSSLGTPGAHLAGKVCSPLVAGYNKLRELTANAADVSVERRDELPAADLASVYQREVPDAIHAVRDERFYEWRFENPSYEYTTYRCVGCPTPAGLVVGQSVGRNEPETTVTRIVDTVPLNCSERHEHVSALLDRVLAESSETDLVVVQPSMLPAEALRARGFLSEKSPPLSYLKGGRTHVVRSLSGWDSHACDISVQKNWHTTFAEFDTY